MRFSIITCTWNSAAFLPETLASVRGQTLQDYEWIFVDGGSTDQTLQLIATQKGDVTVLPGVNGGIARAMNAGLQAATGDIVLHLHSDDYLAHPRVLDRVAASFNAHRCRWLYGRALTDLRGGWTPEANLFPPFSYKRLLQGNIIPHPATFIARDVFTEIGQFDESLRLAMDYDFWLRLAGRMPPLQLPEFLSVFRSHAGSATHANQMQSLVEEHAVRRRYLPDWALSRVGHELRHLKRARALTHMLAAG